MQKITPCLWFDFNADEALAFYEAVFPDFKLIRKSVYGDWGGPHAGKLLVAEFELFGSRFQVLNGGPQFPFTEAISLSISCKGQEETDYYWNKLTADGGQESMCGWLKDKFGLSWQVVPQEAVQAITDPNAERANRASRALQSQKKIIIREILDAADGVPA